MDPSYLVLSRKIGEEIILTAPGGLPVRIMITDIDRNRVQIGIAADKAVKVVRAELLEKEPEPCQT